MDKISTEKRSKNMAAVRSAGNKTTELRLIELFKKNRISGWRRNVKIYGKPDFVFPKLKIAIFVDGCFWHGCSRCKSIPKQNRKFWSNKIDTNKARDLRVSKTLRERGWKVLRIWEHDLALKKRKATLRKLKSFLLR